VGEGQRAVVTGDRTQLSRPVGVGRVDPELGEHGLHDTVEQGCLAGGAPVQDHRVPPQGSPETAHRQAVDPLAVDDLKRGGEHQLTGDLAVVTPNGVPGRR
jgi:hypothetical protein